MIEAGQRVRFDRQRIGPVESASEAALAWRQGLLVADDMPLRQWAGELMRYGGESIECEPSLDPLRVSGTFPSTTCRWPWRCWHRPMACASCTKADGC